MLKSDNRDETIRQNVLRVQCAFLILRYRGKPPLIVKVPGVRNGVADTDDRYVEIRAGLFLCIIAVIVFLEGFSAGITSKFPGDRPIDPVLVHEGFGSGGPLVIDVGDFRIDTTADHE